MKINATYFWISTILLLNQSSFETKNLYIFNKNITSKSIKLQDNMDNFK